VHTKGTIENQKYQCVSEKAMRKYLTTAYGTFANAINIPVASIRASTLVKRVSVKASNSNFLKVKVKTSIQDGQT
jgi:hypothetical protein